MTRNVPDVSLTDHPAMADSRTDGKATDLPTGKCGRRDPLIRQRPPAPPDFNPQLCASAPTTEVTSDVKREKGNRGISSENVYKLCFSSVHYIILHVPLSDRKHDRRRSHVF